MSNSFKGSCLCGSVTYEYTGEPQVTLHCHCSDCRKTSGTGHSTLSVITEDGFTTKGNLTFYDRAADSGNRISRGFCGNCGSMIYSKSSGKPGALFLRVSTLDEPDTIEPAMTIYASRALPWDPAAADIGAFPEMP